MESAKRSDARANTGFDHTPLSCETWTEFCNKGNTLVKFKRKNSLYLAGTFICTIICAGVVLGQEATGAVPSSSNTPSVTSSSSTTGLNLSSVRIKNFGRMDDHFFRGAQPKKDEFKELAALGIKTIIDLREEPVSYEKSLVEASGMRYVNIPMSDTSYPRAENVEEFLKIANDPSTGLFFVHCAGGRHRTGVIGAVYRFNHDHWNFDQVYAEMKKYDFYTRFGHGAMKKFVEDYWQHIQTASATQPTAPSKSTSSSLP